MAPEAPENGPDVFNESSFSEKDVFNDSSNYSDSPAYEGLPEEAEHLLKATQFWVQQVIVPCVVIVGAFGNVTTIVVLTRRRMQNSTTNIYLTALAVSDLSYLLSVFVLSLAHYSSMKQGNHYAYWRVYIYTMFLADSSSELKPVFCPRL
jgi:hypothetical protein